MRDLLSPRERLQRVLAGQKTDRPPVICPGGMMNAAIVDVMRQSGYTLPEAHTNRELMSALALAVNRLTGFENIGVPFCMTVEAEALGSAINFGSLECEPKIQRERYASVRDVAYLPADTLQRHPRAGMVVETIAALARANIDLPVLGSVTGPISAAAAIIEPMTFLKELRRERETMRRVLHYVTGQLAGYARLLADNGAAAIAIADPTATGEILGPKLFTEYAVPCLNQLTEAVQALGVPVIVHICGDVRMVRDGLRQLRANVLSVDAMVSLWRLKQELGGRTVMGNVSTFLLASGKPEGAYNAAAGLVGKGIDIIAPACGLATSTPLRNITAMTDAVRNLFLEAAYYCW